MQRGPFRNGPLVWRRSCDWDGSPPMPTQSSLQTSDTTAVLAALFDGPERGVLAGARIFRPGDISPSLFLLRRGLVKLSALSPQGDELTLRLYRPAEIFGEGCFCRGVHRYCATGV